MTYGIPMTYGLAPVVQAFQPLCWELACRNTFEWRVCAPVSMQVHKGVLNIVCTYLCKHANVSAWMGMCVCAHKCTCANGYVIM